MTTTTYSARPSTHRAGRFTSHELIGSALRNLDEAMLAQRPNEAYAAAYLAAIRAAAAVLAISAKPAARKPTSVWVLLTKHAPQYREWAEFFTACSKKSAACQLGLREIVTQRETDDFLRDASNFVDLVADQLGVTRQLKLSTNSLVTQVSSSAPR